MQREIYQTPKAGSLSRLTRMQDNLPAPEPNEVQVEVKAIGLNFADIMAIMGLYSATPKGAFVPGLEYAGVISAVGSSVKGLSTGDRVMGVTRFGAYATALNIDARYVRPLPEGWSFEEAAAFPVQALTAWYALKELGNLQPGQTVLIQSAAGGVGIWANRIAKQFDARTVGAVGSPHKLPLLREEGYDRAIVRGKKNFPEELDRALEGRDLNLVLECIGGKFFKTAYKRMASEGRIVVYGAAHFSTPGSRPNYFKLVKNYLSRPKVDPLAIISENKSVMGFNLIWLYEKAEKMGELLGKLEQFDLGRPIIGESFSFAELPEALRVFQSGQTVGKVVILT